MQYEQCRRFGVHVYEIDGFHVDVLYDPESSSGFVRAGLDAEWAEWAARWILTEAIAERTSLGTS